MKHRTKTLLSSCVALALVGVLGAFAPVEDDKSLKIGDEVTSWTLTDTTGEEHSFADFEGKTLVLEWYNPGCPYCVAVYDKGLVQETVEAMEKMGEDYVYLAINSTARGKTREDVIKQSETFMKDHKLEIPVLIDYDGVVGKMFDARTTPHMFVIDSEGILRYSGAFSDDPRFKKPEDERTNYVLSTLEQIAKKETVSPDYVKPWGCGVKYASN